MEGYGPEVWQLTFTLKQEIMRLDYYDTHISHPVYSQIWPPEKGQPHTLMEFQYPPETAQPTLLDLLRQKDPRLAKVAASDAQMADVVKYFLEGQSNKILSADATQFLRAALTILSSANAHETMASISLESGFEWILRPPSEPKRATARKDEDRPADAPSLLKPSPPD
jgi:hypothetical protein